MATVETSASVTGRLRTTSSSTDVRTTSITCRLLLATEDLANVRRPLVYLSPRPRSVS